MSYAPQDSAEPNVSRYAPLPMLKRCRVCRIALDVFEDYTVLCWGRAFSGLCRPCAVEVEAFTADPARAAA
jgi:hypothetical protein